ncbi:MAG TPA: pectinesterase family protein [Candidatus Acidoferrum sp.]|nr:pectinesterase family protein [Candidatus Acidoferrum sp.]
MKPIPTSLSNRRPLLAAALAAGLAVTASAQLQWSAYNNTGGLVAANVASGGDATYGQPVTFTVPASTARVFMTTTFGTLPLTNAGGSIKINFTMLANGGLYPGSTGRILGMGLLNEPGTPSTAGDDLGYWCDFNTGNPSFEMFYRPSGMATFFQYDSSHKFNAGSTKTGYPTNNVSLGMQFQLNNSGGTGVTMGTSSSFPNCGAGMTNGSGTVIETSYVSTVTPFTTLGVSNFNEFAFYFNNTSASAIGVTLSGLNLVPLNPGIVTNPADYSGNPGDNVSFTVAINTNAATPLTYQWYAVAAGVTNALTDGLTVNGSTLSGSTNASLAIANVQIADSGYYYVTVTNSYGSSVSAQALLNITPGGSAPTILSISLTNAVLTAGQGTNVSVRATGTPAPAYYWLDNSNNLLLYGTSQLTLTNLQPTNSGTYTVIVSNTLGTDSTNFTLAIYVPPCITQQPTNVLVNLGDPVTFTVVEGGCALPAPTYQWLKNGSVISGATDTSYAVPSAGFGDIALYSVQVSNLGGTVTSANAKLAIYSTSLSAAPLSPANNATAICYDTPLYLSLNQAATAGNSGKVRIFNAANLATPVDTIDLGANSALGVQPRSPFPGDSQAFNYYPVVVSGTTAAIYPHSGAMTSNQTYVVTIEPGVLVDANGAYWPGFTNTSTWAFTTKPTGPANPTNLVVAADGSGDFLTVQGAVDSIPLGNTTYTLINIGLGNFFGIVDIASKSNVTFRGQSRTGSVIMYPNNANIAPSGTTHARMTFKVYANDVGIENLTISNSTPQGGSQAEALMIESGARRCIVNNANISSLQDTILANVNTSQGYFQNTIVRGNYDYVWGGGNLFFSQCTFHTVLGASTYNLTAARTDYGTSSSTGNWQTPDGTKWSSNGLSFVQCTLEADAGVANITLADNNGTPGGQASWVGCTFASPAFIGPSAAISNTYSLWQFQNTDASSAPVSFTNVQTLSSGHPRLLAATNVTTWLNGWSPALAPNILAGPTGQSIAGGGTISLNVSATGVPAPAYQWLRNGSNVTGQTSATLTIPNAYAGDAGTYAVIVSTPAGTVTSGPAVVTVSNTAPLLNAIPDQTVNVGVVVNVAPVATDPDVPPQTLTFSLTSAPANATVDPVTGAFSFRPLTSQAGTSNLCTIMVADDGSPSLSASQSFNVFVNPLEQPSLSSPTWTAGQFSLTFSGQIGPDYIVQVSTDLVTWADMATNTPSSMPFSWIDPDSGSLPLRFYRLRLGP